MTIPNPNPNKCCGGTVLRAASASIGASSTTPKLVSIDDQHGCDTAGTSVIQRIKYYDDDTFVVQYFATDGVTQLPDSTPFTPTKANTFQTNKFITDTVTGEFKEAVLITDTDNGTETYYVAGAAYTLGANEIARDYVEAVALGNEVLAVTGGTPATLTVPANARYAYMNVNGADSMYAHGAAPVAGTDHRVADGGRIEINSAARLASFQIDAFDGASTLNSRVYYYNTNPDIDRT
jgi:hypothetical protein